MGVSIFSKKNNGFSLNKIQSMLSCSFDLLYGKNDLDISFKYTISDRKVAFQWKLLC